MLPTVLEVDGAEIEMGRETPEEKREQVLIDLQSFNLSKKKILRETQT